MNADHPYDKVVRLLEKVRDETGKYCSCSAGAYPYGGKDVRFGLYSEGGWQPDIKYYTVSLDTLEEVAVFLQDFLKERANRGVLFKRF